MTVSCKADICKDKYVIWKLKQFLYWFWVSREKHANIVLSKKNSGCNMGVNFIVLWLQHWAELFLFSVWKEFESPLILMFLSYTLNWMSRDMAEVLCKRAYLYKRTPGIGISCPLCWNRTLKPIFISGIEFSLNKMCLWRKRRLASSLIIHFLTFFQQVLIGV